MQQTTSRGRSRTSFPSTLRVRTLRLRTRHYAHRMPRSHCRVMIRTASMEALCIPLTPTSRYPLPRGSKRLSLKSVSPQSGTSSVASYWALSTQVSYLFPFCTPLRRPVNRLTASLIDPSGEVRASSEESYLQESFASGRTNLKVYTHTLAKRVVFAPNSTRAVGVEVVSGDWNSAKKYMLSASKEVIISAGAFHSPQLLMVSGVGPKAMLEEFNISVVADRPGVGQVRKFRLSTLFILTRGRT